MAANSNTLAMDIGDVRVGMAWAHADVRVPVSLATLLRTTATFWDDLKTVIKQYDISHLVLGLPRGLDGQETAQTAAVRAFAQELATHTTLPIEWQDEALTSVKAEDVLNASTKPFAKEDVDALAACFILSDYLEYRSAIA